MDPKPTVRDVRSADLPAVRLLLRSCTLPDGGIEDQFEDGFVVAEHDGEIIGVAGIERHGRYGLLRSVAVTESSRCRSVGRSLVNVSMVKALEKGVSDVYLLTTDAEGYFRTFGFVAIDRDHVPPEIARSPEYESVCPQTATVMVLRSHGLPPYPTSDPQSGERT